MGNHLHPVILSGGSGTRLWPLSRGHFPKQFLPIYSEKSLLQDTVCRLHDIGLASPIVVCNHATRFIMAEQLQNVGEKNARIVLEPVGRNTAPAIAAAAFYALQKDNDAILLILASDHVITDTKAFGKAIEAAHEVAKQDYLVTFGISPTGPNTEYGYIEAGKDISPLTSHITSFREKPSKAVAEDFIEKGNYFWNSGMFVFKASCYLEALKTFYPDIFHHAEASVLKSTKDLDFIRLDEESFARCESISIDYAIMEKSSKRAMITLDANWSDVGSWGSLWEISEKDSDGNSCKGDVVIQDCHNNYIYSQDKLTAAIGVENLIVVDTKDALLIANKTTGNIRNIVAHLKAQDRTELESHRVVYRPWGHYDSICQGERDKVKRITVKPGAKLSTQTHVHRAEHWVVVKGTAEVRKGDDVFTLNENESVYLPKGTIHSLANKGSEPLEIIEVQTGLYLEEDDIVRLDDVYGRT